MSDRKPDRYHGQGGSYVANGGKRELVERTEEPEGGGYLVDEKTGKRASKAKAPEAPVPQPKGGN
jgi:hypothetical protein